MQVREFSDRYQLQELIDSYNGIELYKACDNYFPRNVYITVFANCNDSAVSSFRSRVRSHAALSHQNIASIYDFEQEGSVCYLISEYREGHTLSEVLNMQGRFSLEEALFMASNMADAIAHAHEHHVIHGDLTSDCIWLQGRDIKIGFLSPSFVQDENRDDNQIDLDGLGNIFKELFSAAPPLFKPVIRQKIQEIIDRLTNQRQPGYGDASDAAYDLKMILQKDLKGLPIIDDELQMTRPFYVTYEEREALFAKNKSFSIWRMGMGKFRSFLFTYFAAFIGILLAGTVFSLLFVNETSDIPTKGLATSIENSTVNMAMAETPREAGTVSISPKEPVSKMGTVPPEPPNLINLKKDDAEKLLLALGYRYAYFWEHSDVPIGTVFAQGWETAPDSPKKRIVFYISSGK